MVSPLGDILYSIQYWALDTEGKTSAKTKTNLNRKSIGLP
jgi:hypothetical protein